MHRYDVGGDGNWTTADSLVVKRLPLCRAQLDLVNTCRSFEREIEYLTECAPILEGNAKSNLAIVECYFGRERVLVMENLCAAGFHSLRELKNDLITLKHAGEAVVGAALANMHAASAGVDWLAKFTKNYPTHRSYLDNAGDIFKSQLGLLLLLSDDLKRQFSDAVAWLENSYVYKQVRVVVKSPDFKALSHGNLLATNILCKLHTKIKIRGFVLVLSAIRSVSCCSPAPTPSSGRKLVRVDKNLCCGIQSSAGKLRQQWF